MVNQPTFRTRQKYNWFKFVILKGQTTEIYALNSWIGFARYLYLTRPPKRVNDNSQRF